MEIASNIEAPNLMAEDLAEMASQTLPENAAAKGQVTVNKLQRAPKQSSLRPPATNSKCGWCGGPEHHSNLNAQQKTQHATIARKLALGLKYVDLRRNSNPLQKPEYMKYATQIIKLRMIAMVMIQIWNPSSSTHSQ